jgi:hypothetical protein
VRASPSRRAVRSRTHRVPAFPPLCARHLPRGCLCTTSPSTSRVVSSIQTKPGSFTSESCCYCRYRASTRLGCRAPMHAHTVANRSVTPCTDTPRAAPFCPHASASINGFSRASCPPRRCPFVRAGKHHRSPPWEAHPPRAVGATSLTSKRHHAVVSPVTATPLR